MKYRRNQGLPSLPCLHSDISSVQTQSRTAVDVQLSPVGQSDAQKGDDVVYSDLVLDDEKNKRKKKKKKTTKSNDGEVTYSTVRGGCREQE
ncbi:hypothetical protein MATL_G00002250 [Megalops atlanticus]|uniref:Uncharacterized protein n=1 Tax=Megalops atlanticus TaxID=7932 RepID=A0A9D3QGN4_MEGAT|nr:hypothetical protein MATL_G00002250 [Megalops atlanticus]